MTKRVKIQTAVLVARRVSCFLRVIASFFAALLLFMFLFPSFATAEIYKWKDKDGNVIFSDSPPPKSNAEKMKLNNNMRLERPFSRENDAPKTGKMNKTTTGQKLIEASDINVVMYMTDW